MKQSSATGVVSSRKLSLNSTIFVRALWLSLTSALIAGIIYTLIFAITSKGFNGFIQGALVVVRITFVVAFLLDTMFSTVFGRKA